MIHELFGMMDERKFSAPASLLLAHGSTNSSPSSTPTMSSPNTTNTTEPQQNLRCPRCDSSNTKFCYYNNYNLTQPRHFCKTCRRYWTKGGALRNVPIGGGCRKVKPCRSVAVKPKPATNIVAGLDEELQSSAAGIWNPPYSSQLLDLLRSSQFQNPNPNSMRVKEEGSMVSPHMAAAPASTMYEQGFSLDSLGQLTAAPFNSLWRSVATPAHYQYHQQQPQLHHHQHHQQQQQQQHHHQHQQQQQHQQQHNMFMGEMQGSSGIQELLQKLKSSANYNNYGSLSPSVSTSMGISSGAGSVLEPLPLSGGEVGYWNPAPVSWADLSTANGAFP